MAQNVVYADLKFAAGPLPTASPCPTDSDENDSPYENVPVGPVPVAPSPGRWRWCCRVPRGLLAVSLLLLLVATVSLGACYWQVTRRLRHTSQENAAERGHLSQELSMREQSLEQAQLELAWTRAELQRAWQEGNGSQLELSKQDAELERARRELAVLERQLRASESTVSSLRACVNTDCCPSGWVLYRSKCLFVSMEKKSWWESCDDCRKKSARLLIQDNWPSWTVPVQSRGARGTSGGVIGPCHRKDTLLTPVQTWTYAYYCPVWYYHLAG
ncbi:B-cell differentiation antigen CD72-like [Dryobates pubescens]|uniref:B-cell differentiation antigen CD72-like n=1 Tax=Dryobates pubescens TaxID=118200 RepID=UPI0023B9F5FC|nr:B-cell differentiation antigen CD72-like [Dryobates pubescens]